MNKKEKKKIDPVKDRQIELYQEYYDVDEANKTIDISLHYEKASELLNLNMCKKEHPLFGKSFLEEVQEIIENAPIGYKLHLNFEIDDYEGYDPKVLIKSFNDTLELGQYNSRNEKQRKQWISAILVLIGILILFMMTIIKDNEILGEGIRSSIITEVMDIIAWVFVWEAATILFLDHSEQTKLTLFIKHRVSKIAMYQTGSENPLIVEEGNNVFSKWTDEKVKKIGKYSLLISSSFILFMSFYNIYAFIIQVKGDQIEKADFALNLIVLIITTILAILAGIAGILTFNGKKSKITKFVGIYAIILLVIVILQIIMTISYREPVYVVSAIFSFIFNLFYIFGYFVNKYAK